MVIGFSGALALRIIRVRGPVRFHVRDGADGARILATRLRHARVANGGYYSEHAQAVVEGNAEYSI
jgi:hypothetical protein